MIRTTSCLLAVIALATSPLGSRGDQIVYSDTFDSGASMGTASQYFSDAGQNNGLVLQSENIYNTPGISHDVSGTGYFLFEGTSTESVPAGQSAFYISQSFATTLNTMYSVSFYLTNDSDNNDAEVSASINGTALGGGSTVSAIGDYQTNGFQQFTFTFNSGNSTTATLTLNDLQTATIGNDFAVDNILVSVPEPSSIALCGIAGVAGLAISRFRTRRKRAAA